MTQEEQALLPVTLEPTHLPLRLMLEAVRDNPEAFGHSALVGVCQRALDALNTRPASPPVDESAIAELVHDAMYWAAEQKATNPKPWQNGNSLAEDRARLAARKIAALSRPDAVTDGLATPDAPNAGVSDSGRFWYGIGYSTCWADCAAQRMPPLETLEAAIDHAWSVRHESYEGDLDADAGVSELVEALAEARSTLFTIFECSDDELSSKAAKEAFDKADALLSRIGGE